MQQATKVRRFLRVGVAGALAAGISVVGAGSAGASHGNGTIDPSTNTRILVECASSTGIIKKVEPGIGSTSSPNVAKGIKGEATGCVDHEYGTGLDAALKISGKLEGDVDCTGNSAFPFNGKLNAFWGASGVQLLDAGGKKVKSTAYVRTGEVDDPAFANDQSVIRFEGIVIKGVGAGADFDAVVQQLPSDLQQGIDCITGAGTITSLEWSTETDVNVVVAGACAAFGGTPDFDPASPTYGTCVGGAFHGSVFLEPGYLDSAAWISLP